MASLLKCVRNLLRRSSWEKYNKSGQIDPLYCEDRYFKLYLIHSGADGEVYHGLDCLTGTSVAIKTLVKPIEQSAAEVVISNCLGRNCSRCIPTFDTYEENGQAHIVSPFLENGDLLDHIFHRNTLNEGDAFVTLDIDQAMLYFAQILVGVKEIHNFGFVHGDIKLENLLLDEKKRLRICDFGRAKKFSSDDMQLYPVGTLSYSAPETINKTPIFGPEMDVWSIGVCLYVMLSGHFPFSGQDLDEVADEILTRVPHDIQRPLPIELAKLLSDMHCKNPALRISMDAIMAHSFVKPYVKAVRKSSFSQL